MRSRTPRTTGGTGTPPTWTGAKRGRRRTRRRRPRGGTCRTSCTSRRCSPAVAEGYAALPNKRVTAANSVEYAYRDTGETGDTAAGTGGVPLVLLQHFRGNLDGWDP